MPGTNPNRANALSADDAALEIEANTIGSGISCDHNATTPVNDGRFNTISGIRSGQLRPSERYSCTNSMSVPKDAFGWTNATVVPRDPGRGVVSMTRAPSDRSVASAEATSATR